MFSNAQTLESAYPLKEDPVPLSKRGYHTNNKYDNVGSILFLFELLVTSFQNFPTSILQSGISC